MSLANNARAAGSAGGARRADNGGPTMPRLQLLLATTALVAVSSLATPAQAVVNVSDDATLRTAIFAANTGGDAAINLTGNITLLQSLPMITSNVTLTGNGFTLDANNTGRAIFVASGTVNVSNLTLANARAQGGAGGAGALAGGGGGGGLGAGAAVFVNGGATLTLSLVQVQNAASAGGAGGTAGPGCACAAIGGGGGGGLGGAGGSSNGTPGGGGGGYAGNGGSQTGTSGGAGG